MYRILFVFLLFSTSIFSQTAFDRANPPVSESGNTLTNAWAGGINFPLISSIDLDSDGTPDLFLFDKHNNRILTFINNGSTSADLAWDYAPEYAAQFPPVNKWAFLYDFNCDGRMDFFTLSSALQCSGIAAYMNVTTGAALQWAIADSCMQASFMGAPTDNIFANAISLPHFNDIDGDGDMDILGYNTIPDGRVMLYRNHSMDDFGDCDSLKFILETMCWGDFQLLIGGGSNSVNCFHCPCRSGNIVDDQPQALAPPPYDPSEAARRDDTISSLFAIDLDGDGNKELLVGDVSSSNTLMIHNGGADMDAQDLSYPVAGVPALFHSFHFHAWMDVDNDSLKDLLVSAYDDENKNGIWFYKNSGTNTNPIFSFIQSDFLQDNMIDAGEDACPTFFDYDSDGLQDLVIGKAVFDTTNGTYKTGLFLYGNTGTLQNPEFNLVTENFANLSATATFQSPVYPAFGDLDGDGDKDMLIGREDGFLYYYQNNAPSGSPATFAAVVPNYMHIDVGKFATPQLFDLDHDGLLDLICGFQRGSIHYYKNIGNASGAVYDSVPSTPQLGCIALHGAGTPDGYTAPFFYDSLGSTRLLVAWEEGNINQYDQIDGNLGGCFHQTGTVLNPAESTRIKFNITVSGGDINGDSLTDIVIGQSTGGVELRYQHSLHIGISEADPFRPSFTVFPNPASEEIFVRIQNKRSEKAVLRMYNSIGEVVYETNVKGEQFHLKTSTLAAGMYFLQLISEKHSFSRKVVVRY